MSTYDDGRSSPQEWAERVRHEVVRQLDPQTRLGGGGHSDANGAYLLRCWSSVDGDVPVLYLIYRHPWWGFATGLRRELDGGIMASHSGDPAINLADDIVIGDVGEPLGRDADSRGVGFRSLTESIDTTTAGGRLVFSIFGALADFERQLIRDRTLAGLEAARARGRVGGRPTVMTPARVEAARALLARPGATVTSVARDLGVSRATLYRTVLAEGEGDTVAEGAALSGASAGGGGGGRSPGSVGPEHAGG